MVISMDDVRKRYKVEGNYFQKGYFEAYNNPNRVKKELPNILDRINKLLVAGKLEKAQSDFVDGLRTGLADVTSANLGKG